MKKFKLVKTYPNSPELGEVIEMKEGTNMYFYKGLQVMYPDKYPEYWQEVVELCVPVGTKFTHENNNEFVYTIDGIFNNNKCVISWDKNKYERSQIEYNILFVNELFQKGTWIEYKKLIIYCITEDGYEITSELENLYWVNDKFNIYTKKAGNCKSNVKYYSTRKVAENYIKCHKPVLSYQDVLSMFDEIASQDDWGVVGRNTLKPVLTKLVKSKLNMND